MNSERQQSFNVGFVLFIATLILIVALFTVGGRGGLEDKVHYSFLLESANNVRPGTKVILDGVAVGQVRSVEFQAARDQEDSLQNIEIEIGISARNRHRIREGTKVWLQADGLLGDQIVAVQSGSFEKPEYPPGSRLPFEERTMVDGLLGAQTREDAEALMSELVRLLRSVQDEKGSVGKFLKDSTIYDSADAVVANADRTLESTADILEGMRSGEKPLAALLLGPDDAAALSEAIQGLRAITANQRLSRALEDQLPDLIERLDAVVARLDRGEGTLGLLLNDPTIAQNLNNVFLGVREEPIVRNLIRNAERKGSTIHAGAMGRDDAEARIRAAIAARVLLESAAPRVAVAETGDEPGQLEAAPEDAAIGAGEERP